MEQHLLSDDLRLSLTAFTVNFYNGFIFDAVINDDAPSLGEIRCIVGNTVRKIGCKV